MAVRGGVAVASFLVLGLWGDSGTMGADSAAHIARGRYAVMPGNGAGGARRALLEVRYKQRPPNRPHISPKSPPNPPLDPRELSGTLGNPKEPPRKGGDMLS